MNLSIPRRGTWPLLVVLALFAALAVACGGDEDGSDDGGSPTSVAESTEGAGDANGAGDADSEDDSDSGDSSDDGDNGDSAGNLSGLPQELQQAVTRTQSLDTVEFEMTMTMAGMPGLGSDASFVATGAIDTPAERMRMSMDMSQLFESAMEAEGEELDEMAAAMMQALLGDGGMEFVFADGMTYVRWPLITAFAGVSTEWVAMPVADDEDPFAGVDDVSGLGGGFTNPSDMLASLDGISSLEQAGTEDVRGVSTTRYDGVVDANAAMEAMSPEDRAEMEAAGIDDFPTMPMSLWVDDDGLVRRMQMEVNYAELLEGSAAAAGNPESMVITMEFFNFGGDVNIDVPSENEVTIIEEDELFGGFGGGLEGGAGGFGGAN